MKLKVWPTLFMLGSFLILAIGAAQSSWAQPAREVNRGLVFDPGGRLPISNRLPTLRDLVSAKIDTVEGERKLVVMIDMSESGPILATSLKQIKSTRKVIVDGVEKDQEYLVTVPVTEVIQGSDSPVQGRKPVVIDVKEVNFFDLSGKLVPLDEVAQRHKMLRPLFFLERFTGELPAIPDLYRQVLVEDCLIATTKLPIRNQARAAIPAVPLVPATIR